MNVKTECPLWKAMFILDQRDPRSWYDEQLKLTGVASLLVVRGNLSKTKLLSFCHTQHNKLLWSGKAFFFFFKEMIHIIATWLSFFFFFKSFDKRLKRGEIKSQLPRNNNLHTLAQVSIIKRISFTRKKTKKNSFISKDFTDPPVKDLLTQINCWEHHAACWLTILVYLSSAKLRRPQSHWKEWESDT